MMAAGSQSTTVRPVRSMPLWHRVKVTPSAVASSISSARVGSPFALRSAEHTSELQSLMRISYAVFCLKKKNIYHGQRTQLRRYQTTTQLCASRKLTPQNTRSLFAHHIQTS